MKTIKFRAWDKIDKELLTGDDGNGSYMNDMFGYFDISEDETRYVLMQFIGLKDKNGKEIYEGDIYIIHGYLEDESDYEDKYVIAYEDFSDCCVNGIGYSFGKHGSPASIEQIEVIGNIYENEDLLTKKL